MIVDLERNDLGRVCEPGSVRVSRAWALETHPTVHHLVSVVEGRLEAKTRLSALLKATFPGGSITGAPKLAAAGIIDALEPSRRGLYCGAIGYLDAAGGGDLNIAIRTAWTDSSTAYYQAGGGIVWDSDAAWRSIRYETIREAYYGSYWDSEASFELPDDLCAVAAAAAAVTDHGLCCQFLLLRQLLLPT